MNLELVIFDWAGTTVDHGSMAPVAAVTGLFAANGIELSPEQARRDMGLYKRDHIQKILATEVVTQKWVKLRGCDPADSDVDQLFAQFKDLQTEWLTRRARLIAGVLPVVERLRGRGLKIGSTTGYTRPMLDLLLGHALQQGYVPDYSLCPDDTAGGRPLPWMCYSIALRLQLTRSSAAVKIGDTPSDIEEGRRAGMWTIGITATGNEVGLTEEDFTSLSEAERKRLTDAAALRLREAGAHEVANSVSECESVLDLIEARISRGERP